MLDFVGKRRWFLLASAIIAIVGLISALLPGGLKLGMDFKGGMSATVIPLVTLAPNEGETLTLDQVKQKLTDLGFSEAAEGVQPKEEKFSIPTVNLSEDDEDRLKDGLAEIGQVEAILTLDQVKQRLSDPDLGLSQAAERVQQLGESEFFIRTPSLTINEQTRLKSALGEIGQVRDFMLVDPIVASETTRNAAIAMGVATIAMLLYIAWAFRKVPNPFRYGTCAVITLLFSLLVTVGVFSLLGRTLNWEIDPMFITAILAIIGYGINDTIVVLDRIRENLGRHISPDFGATVNYGIVQTLGRSLNTSITTLLAVLAVYLFVGGPIRNFLLALFVGIVASTYGSIFIASQLLVVWERGEWGGFLRKIPLPQRFRAR